MVRRRVPRRQGLSPLPPALTTRAARQVRAASTSSKIQRDGRDGRCPGPQGGRSAQARAIRRVRHGPPDTWQVLVRYCHVARRVRRLPGVAGAAHERRLDATGSIRLRAMHARDNLADLTAHAMPGLEVAERLGSVVTRGLGEREATRRRRVFGPSIVAGGTRPSQIALTGRQFASPPVWVLAAAVLVSGFLLDQWVDVSVIGAIVLLIAALGYLQEVRAEGALAGVQKLTAPVRSWSATVRNVRCSPSTSSPATSSSSKPGRVCQQTAACSSRRTCG